MPRYARLSRRRTQMGIEMWSRRSCCGLFSESYSAGIQRIICADNRHYPLNRRVIVSTFCLISVHKASRIQRIMISEYRK